MFSYSTDIAVCGDLLLSLPSKASEAMLSHILKPQREPVTGPYNPSSLDTDLPHILTVMFTQMITACISHREIREERQHQRLYPTRWHSEEIAFQSQFFAFEQPPPHRYA
ncbi:hypothetical protein N7453_008347 [Penicillium expansum]|nr:hypothetical protein N7453_008347 [Penicillium expansum]